MCEQHRRTGLRDVSWTVDIALAGQIQPWAREQAQRLARECAEMAEYFPHWILVLGRPSLERPHACPRCGECVVPIKRVWRCLACGKALQPPDGSSLAWVGHLPVLWPHHPRLEALGAPPPGHALIEAAGQRYLLVPAGVYYPDNFPRAQPVVRYTPGLLPFLRLQPGGAIHTLSGDLLCLYYTNQWNGVSVRAVLQQRVVNHLTSLVKIAMGRRPEEAFIGRIHEEPWTAR